MALKRVNVEPNIGSVMSLQCELGIYIIFFIFSFLGLRVEMKYLSHEISVNLK